MAPALGDPYAEYLAWKQAGRPDLTPADLLGGGAIALPAAAADDVPEDEVRMVTTARPRLTT